MLAGRTAAAWPPQCGRRLPRPPTRKALAIRRMPMDHETVLAYLDRVGVTGPAVSDAAGLRTLHRAHQLAVPFENLSIHLAEPISLDEPDLIDKIVLRRRVGFCYELNEACPL